MAPSAKVFADECVRFIIVIHDQNNSHAFCQHVPCPRANIRHLAAWSRKRTLQDGCADCQADAIKPLPFPVSSAASPHSASFELSKVNRRGLCPDIAGGMKSQV